MLAHSQQPPVVFSIPSLNHCVVRCYINRGLDKGLSSKMKTTKRQMCGRTSPLSRGLNTSRARALFPNVAVLHVVWRPFLAGSTSMNLLKYIGRWHSEALCERCLLFGY